MSSSVQCSANRGRTYEVCFDDTGEIVSVRVKVYGATGVHWRMVWNQTYGEMTTTAACAARAAIMKRGSAQPQKASGGA